MHNRILLYNSRELIADVKLNEYDEYLYFRYSNIWSGETREEKIVYIGTYFDFTQINSFQLVLIQNNYFECKFVFSLN